MSGGFSRRSFVQRGAGALATSFGFNLEPAQAAARELKISRTTQTHSICPYCAVGCSVIIHTIGDQAHNVKSTVVHVEGDTSSPINRGTLCPKGISLKQFIVNDRRLTRPLFRAGGTSEWKPISWDAAIDYAARWIKDSRDAGLEAKDAQGQTVSYLFGIRSRDRAASNANAVTTAAWPTFCGRLLRC